MIDITPLLPFTDWAQVQRIKARVKEKGIPPSDHLLCGYANSMFWLISLDYTGYCTMSFSRPDRLPQASEIVPFFVLLKVDPTDKPWRPLTSARGIHIILDEGIAG